MNSQTVTNAMAASAPRLFDFLPHLPVVVEPTAGQLSSDAGLLPIRQFDQRWNYTARVVACVLVALGTALLCAAYLFAATVAL